MPADLVYTLGHLADTGVETVAGTPIDDAITRVLARLDVVVRGLESFTMGGAEWIGDFDGNGTDDVLAKDGARWLVLGHE